MRILAGDIGGTHTRLVYLQDSCVPAIRHEKYYASSAYSGLSKVIDAFISECGIERSFDAACFAVAGPVIAGKAALTNLPWYVCEAELATQLKTERVSLINDLAAVAYAIPDLQSGDLLMIQQGENHSGLPVSELANFNAVVIGVGTGLGAAHLVSRGGDYQVLSSEAGHTSFAPVTAVQQQLLVWLHRTHAHVSVEMLLSGRGIHTLYQCFRDELDMAESTEVRSAMQGMDPAQVISQYSEAGDELCIATLDCFIAIFAGVVGDIVLHHYPVKGVYLTGGIALKLQHRLSSAAATFSERFASKGAMQENLKGLPVNLIMTETPGLDGAISYARRQSLPAS